MSHVDYANLLPPLWETQIKDWVHEDLPGFDIGGFVVGNKPEAAVLNCKSPCTFAGKPFFEEVMKSVNCTTRWLPTAVEGSLMDKPQPIAVVEGPCRCILAGERTALNILSRCSGVATGASLAVQQNKKDDTWISYRGKIWACYRRGSNTSI
eukprot:388691_1